VPPPLNLEEGGGGGTPGYVGLRNFFFRVRVEEKKCGLGFKSGSDQLKFDLSLEKKGVY